MLVNGGDIELPTKNTLAVALWFNVNVLLPLRLTIGSGPLT